MLPTKAAGTTSRGGLAVEKVICSISTRLLEAQQQQQSEFSVRTKKIKRAITDSGQCDRLADKAIEEKNQLAHMLLNVTSGHEQSPEVSVPSSLAVLDTMRHRVVPHLCSSSHDTATMADELRDKA